MSRSDAICWAILVPGGAERVAWLARIEWHRRYGDVVDGEPWDIVPGSRQYSAIVEREPGSEGSDDSVAAALSGQVDQPVFLLRFRADVPVVWVYERGRWARALDEAPGRVAERLGCPLVEMHVPRHVFVLAVAKGASCEDVHRALGESADEPWCHCEPTASGALVYSEDGDIGGLAYRVSERLPDATVFEILGEPDTEGFTVTELVAGNEVRRQEVSSAEAASALGIPPRLLGLEH